MSTPYLDNLPAEILHRILDYVDSETIFLSFRNVCKYFYAIINSYNQYKLDFRSITKPAFHHVCHLIQPEHVISLIISNEYKTPGQIYLFISLFDIHKFTRLRSITLMQSDTQDLNIYLKHVSTCPLVSLSIDRGRSLTGFLILEIEQLFMNCPVRYLTFTEWMLSKELLEIFFHAPHLETLTLDGIVMLPKDDKLTFVEIKSKLTSLTMNFYGSNMDKIISILSFTQSLIHLKLIGQPTTYGFVWDGCWWSQFIQNNLPKLQFFEFFFDKRIDHTQSTGDIESIITSFQTSFWLEKKWYVVCDYYKNTQELQLYSIPICKSNFLYKSTSNQISHSNLINPTPYIMDNVCSLIMHFTPTTDVIRDLNLLPNRPLFFRATNLTLLIANDFSNDSIDHLSSLIDLSHLDTLSLILDLTETSFENISTVMNSLFDRTYNIQSIGIQSTRLKSLLKYLEIIFSMMSNQVKHLTVETDNAKDTEWIFNRFEKFSSIHVKTKIGHQWKYEEIRQEFEKQGRDNSYYNNITEINIWFGKQKLNN